MMKKRIIRGTVIAAMVWGDCAFRVWALAGGIFEEVGSMKL